MKLLTGLFTILMLMFSVYSYAQQPKPFKEKSDPEARKILKKLQETYDADAGIYVKYKLTMEFGQDKEIQSGEIFQKGDKYNVNNNGNVIICDGATVWVYTKKQNQCQINDYEKDEDIFSPSKLLNIYKADDEYFYAITDANSGGYKIEFKPYDKDSEIMKVRIEVDKSKTKLLSVKVFGDDGARYTFDIESLKNTTVSSSKFKFDKAQYPGVKVVDLRD